MNHHRSPRRLLTTIAVLTALAVLTAACGSDTDEDPAEPAGGLSPSSGALVDGGLTVEEALGLAPSSTVIAVKGFLHRDDTGTNLCSALAESLPPQCGGAWVELVGLDVENLDVPVNTSAGVSWTDTTISVLGRIDDGVLTIDPTVAG